MIAVMLFSWKSDFAVCPVQSACWNISVCTKGTSGKIIVAASLFSCEYNFDEFIFIAPMLRIPAHSNKINVTTKRDVL